MRRRAIRNVVIATLVIVMAALASPTPAQAIPPAGPGQSVTFTFYSDASRTIEVGWWSYGICGEPFDFGTHTPYFRHRIITCLP